MESVSADRIKSYRLSQAHMQCYRRLILLKLYFAVAGCCEYVDLSTIGTFVTV